MLCLQDLEIRKTATKDGTGIETGIKIEIVGKTEIEKETDATKTVIQKKAKNRSLILIPKLRKTVIEALETVTEIETEIEIETERSVAPRALVRLVKLVRRAVRLRA